MSIILIITLLFCSFYQSHQQQNSSQPQVIFVVGGPGSGKGTQCQKLIQEFSFAHLSTGDLLRQAVETDNQEANEIRMLMSEGKLISSELLVEMMKRRIFKDTEQKTFLLDGFPRGFDNYEAWKGLIGEKVKVLGLFYLNCPLTVLEQRLLERGKKSGRVDDNIESIRKRFHTFHEETDPFISYYEENIGKVHRISSEESIQIVFEKVKKAVEEMMNIR